MKRRLSLMFLTIALAWGCSAPSRDQLAGSWVLARAECGDGASSPTLKLAIEMNADTFQETLEETGKDGKSFAALSSGVVDGDKSRLVLRRTSTDIYLGHTVKHLAWDGDSQNEMKVLKTDPGELALEIPGQCGPSAGRIVLSRR